MSVVTISLILALGAGTWIFRYLQRTSGNNTRRSASVAGFCALAIFFLLIIFGEFLL